MRVLVLLLTVVVRLAAVEYQGQVTLDGRVIFADEPVPGATVAALQGHRTVTAFTNDAGEFQLTGLDAGPCSIRVEMRGFAIETREITLPLAAPVAVSLTMRAYEAIMPVLSRPPERSSLPVKAETAATSTSAAAAGVISGSLINGAVTPDAQSRAFGNNRPRGLPLYNFAVGAILGNSALNARPYSFATGGFSPEPSYADLQLNVAMAGPIHIPWLVNNGPNMILMFQRGDSHQATTASGIMPTAAARAGDFSQFAGVIRDPITGQPFAGNQIPIDRLSPQALSLLSYYPLPNGASTTGVNFQAPLLSSTTSDQLQFSTSQKTFRNRVQLGTSLAWNRSTTISNSIFDFNDTARQSSIAMGLKADEQLSTHVLWRSRYQFSQSASSVTPFFANRANVSGAAGISGNDQDPASWGPPTLVFPNLAGLADVEHQHTVTTTHAPGGEVQLRPGDHNITIGGDFAWNIVEVQSQPDPRGTLTFTGSATGNPLADFLLGIPSASAIAFGNTKTHLDGVAPDAYANDDWRPLANVSVNAGLRWEYDSPYTEASGHLANLDVAPNFTAVSPVLATDPVGALTGTRYPTSLIRPDKRGLEPRLGFSWRPSVSSLLVVKGTFGVYRNLGAYQALALLLSQQAPFAKTFNIQNTPAAPLTLANAFPSSPVNTINTFAIDPNFRTANAQNWSISAQRELTASLTMIVAYLGAKGTHLMQAFLPNTDAPGSVAAGVSAISAPAPSGFIYVTSNGASLKNAAQITLRRRLYAGLTWTVQYTLSKATDDAATFSNGAITPSSLSIAQNWRELNAEQGPSSFDQRHLVTTQFQYTTGVGMKGGTLVDGFRGALWKDWTIASRLDAGSGMPFTPIAFLSVGGTGVVGIRPSLTGVPITPVAAGSYANATAFTTPAPGSWGDAGRDSIRGPKEFSMDMSVARVFRLGKRLNLEYRVASTNVLNRVTFSAIDTVITSPQFGLPTVANQMRTLQMSVRVRF